MTENSISANIVHAKYNTFTVHYRVDKGLI